MAAKRPDGYHDIETLFERISLYDVLRFKTIPSGIRLVCTGRPLPDGPGNLVYRAAALLKEKYGVKEGVEIRLEKKIPVAAGLGGGSSDAAAALLGLNRVWKLRLSRKALLGHAASLGSDVAFFVLDTPYALGAGRGEKLKPVSSRVRLWHVLASPPLEVLTKDIYSALRPEDFGSQRIQPSDFFTAYRAKDPDRLGQALYNTLEKVVLDRAHILRRVKSDFLLTGVDGVLMSGSGPTVFALLRTEKEAKRVASAMRRKYNFAFTVVSTAL